MLEFLAFIGLFVLLVLFLAGLLYVLVSTLIAFGIIAYNLIKLFLMLVILFISICRESLLYCLGNRPSIYLILLGWRFRKHNLKLTDCLHSVFITDRENPVYQEDRKKLIRSVRRRGVNAVYNDLLLEVVFGNQGSNIYRVIMPRNHLPFYCLVSVLGLLCLALAL
jgi:hypothetical protein